MGYQGSSAMVEPYGYRNDSTALDRRSQRALREGARLHRTGNTDREGRGTRVTAVRTHLQPNNTLL